MVTHPFDIGFLWNIRASVPRGWMKGSNPRFVSVRWSLFSVGKLSWER